MDRHRPLPALAALALTTGLVALAPAAAAAPSCDAYSAVCAPAPTGVLGETVHRVAPARVAPAAAAQLPFTGAEVTLVVVLGVGGVGLGTAMTLAGRRRRATTA